MSFRRLVTALCAVLAFSGASTAPPEADVQWGVRTYRSIDAQVAKHGWSCVFVQGDKKESNFAYSVGLSGKAQPELLLVSGDDEKAACAMLNLVAKALLARSSPIRDGDAPVAKMASSVRVRTIFPDEFFDKCGFAKIWRDQHHIKDATGMQIVFADDHGRFPD